MEKSNKYRRTMLKAITVLSLLAIIIFIFTELNTLIVKLSDQINNKNYSSLIVFIFILLSLILVSLLLGIDTFRSFFRIAIHLSSIPLWQFILKMLMTMIFLIPISSKILISLGYEYNAYRFFVFIVIALISYIFINQSKLFDSFSINCIYGLNLLLITGFIFYILNIKFGVDFIYVSIFNLIYIACEARLLLYEEAFDRYPTWSDWRSFPTPAIFISTPFVGLYSLIFMNRLFKNLDIKQILFIIWIIVRYHIINPYWFRQDNEDDESIIGRLRLPKPAESGTIFWLRSMLRKSSFLRVKTI